MSAGIARRKCAGLSPWFFATVPLRAIYFGRRILPKTTPSQTFRAIFNMWVRKNTPQKERESAERKMDAWLQRNGKTRADVSAIIAQAAADDAAARPPPPPSDPRDGAPHPFDNPKHSP